MILSLADYITTVKNIVQVYVPTADKDHEVVEGFHGEILSALKQVNSGEVLLFIGT